MGEVIPGSRAQMIARGLVNSSPSPAPRVCLEGLEDTEIPTASPGCSGRGAYLPEQSLPCYQHPRDTQLSSNCSDGVINLEHLLLSQAGKPQSTRGRENSKTLVGSIGRHWDVQSS